jgi:FkbM family methyltransferase
MTFLRKWHRLPDHPMKLRLMNKAISLYKKDVLVEEFGCKFSVCANECIGRMLLLGDEFERRSVNVVRETMSSGGVFVDVGANFGLYSIIASNFERVECFGFEPDARNFIRFGRNIALNGRSNVTAINVALAKDLEFVGLNEWLGDNLGAIKTVDKEGVASLSVSMNPAVAFDKLGIKDIRCLKIDIEGQEYEVLREVLGEYRPSVVVSEFVKYPEPKDESVRPLDQRSELWNLMVGAGYVARDVDGVRVSNVDFETYYPEGNLVFSME